MAKKAKKFVKKSTKKVVDTRTDEEKAAAWEKIKAEHMEHIGISDKNEEAADQIVQILHGKHNAGNVLAAVFQRISCPTLYMEWTANRYWGNYCRKYVLQALERVYDQLVKEKHTEKKPRNYNDGDDNLWYVPDPKKDGRRIIIHTSQNINLIFIWDGKFLDKDLWEYSHLHIRRYYPQYETADKADKWDKEYRERDEQEYKDKGVLWSVRKADSLAEYSDDVLKNQYPSRYGLDHYKKNKFEVKYGDFRDKGYVLSYERNSVEGAMNYHGIIKLVLDCYVPCMLTELFNDEHHEFLSGWYEQKSKKEQ
jgi:hypothetical protein